MAELLRNETSSVRDTWMEIIIFPHLLEHSLLDAIKIMGSSVNKLE